MSHTDPKLLCLKSLFLAASMVLGGTPALRADDPPVADASAKAKVLDSLAWHKTMEQFEEWLSVQVIYGKDQVSKLRQAMQANVGKMSSVELQLYMNELQEKLAILSSPEAFQARAWAEDHLTKASDAAAAEFRKKLPDVATMTVAQLKQALQDNQLQRENHLAMVKSFEKTRDEQITAIRTQQAQAAAAARRAASYSNVNVHPGYSGGSLAPRTVTRYPGIGAGSYGWGGWRW